jgi:hypothetical protein
VSGEDEARRFYRDLLGIRKCRSRRRLPLARAFGFERGDLKIHLGVDKQFVAARKAHPALLVAICRR